MLLFIFGRLKNERVLLLLELGSLARHHYAQELVLEALGGDHEIEQGDLDRRLGQVVRIPQLGGDVESEIGRVLNDLIAEFDAQAAALLERLLQEQRLQQRVQLLADVLEQTLFFSENLSS